MNIILELEITEPVELEISEQAPINIYPVGSIAVLKYVPKRESFTATDGQTVFTPEIVTLTEYSLIFVNQALQNQDTYVITDVLTFNTGLNADDIVLIYG